jgi:hypothetical protein
VRIVIDDEKSELVEIDADHGNAGRRVHETERVDQNYRAMLRNGLA